MLGKYLELPTAHCQGDEVVEELFLLRGSEVTHVTRQGVVQGATVPAGDSPVTPHCQFKSITVKKCIPTPRSHGKESRAGVTGRSHGQSTKPTASYGIHSLGLKQAHQGQQSLVEGGDVLLSGRAQAQVLHQEKPAHGEPQEFGIQNRNEGMGPSD